MGIELYNKLPPELRKLKGEIDSNRIYKRFTGTSIKAEGTLYLNSKNTAFERIFFPLVLASLLKSQK
jgi:hypothetical protein